MSFDREQYGKLLAEFQPRIIESVEEHEQMLTAAEQLMEKGEGLSPEEKKVLALLVVLIDAFEASDDDEDDGPVELPKPFETLRRLMEARSLSLHDIADVFGNPVAAREALEGKRQISRGQAKQLSNFFRVPVKLFQS